MIIYGLRAPFPFLKGHVRHVRPVWLMEEMGIPYDLHFLDLEKGEEEAKEYLEINPFGKVPALTDGSLKLSESGAICSYLAEKYGQLIPPAKTPERAKHDQWMYVAVTMIEPHTVRVLAADFFYKDEPEGPVLRAAALESLKDSLGVLENHLSENTYLMGNDFTVSDIMMTASLRLLSHTDVLKEYPRICSYMNRNIERPAFLKAAELQ
jgi:glutathione S-transferase